MSNRQKKKNVLRLHSYAGDFRAFKYFVMSSCLFTKLESKIVVDPKLLSKRNPTNTYPALDFGDSELMVGDLTICQYLLKHGATMESQQLDSWTEWACRSLEEAVGSYANAFLFPDRPGQKSKSVYDLQRSFLEDEKIRSTLQIAETRLKGRSYFTQHDTMTTCDVIVACAMYYPFAFLITKEHREKIYPNLLRHFLSCMRTNSFRSLFGDGILYEGVLPSVSSAATTTTTTTSNHDETIVSLEALRRAAHSMSHPLKNLESTLKACSSGSSQDNNTSRSIIFQVSKPLEKQEKLKLPDLTTHAGMNALNEHLKFRNFLFEGKCTKQDVSLRDAIIKVMLECIRKEGEIQDVLSSTNFTTSQLARLGLFELSELEDIEKNKKDIISRLRLEHRRLRKLNRGRAQTIGSNKTVYPHVKRWFDVVTSLIIKSKQDIPSPSQIETSVWSQERQLRILRVVRARDHPLYAEFFDFLERKVPLFGVYSRMDKSLDKSVLDTPEKLIPVFEGQVARPDPLKPRDLNLLTKKEACNVLINVSKKGPSQLTTMDLGVLSIALHSSKDVEKNKGGEFLLRAADDFDMFLEIAPDCDEKIAKEASRVIQNIKTEFEGKVNLVLMTDATKRAPKKRLAQPINKTSFMNVRGGLKLEMKGEEFPCVVSPCYRPEKNESIENVEMIARDENNLEILLEMIDEKNASDTVIAFDFDLTLKGAVDPLTNTPRVRDGERTFEILRKLKEMNVTMVIVTARQASERAWESVRSRASDLGLLNFIGKGRNMTKKVRNDVKQFYDMVKKEMETIPSKKRKKYPSKELVLKHFAFEFQKMFPEGNGSKLLSQALGKTKTVNLKSLRDAVQNILPPSQMEPPRYHGVPEIELKHQELPPKYMFQKCRSATGKKVWPCWEFTSTNGKSVVAGEGMIMTEHDKAECLHAYLDAYRLRPKHIIFVDDFVGNAYNFAWYFSDNKNNVSKQVPWPEKHHFGDRTNGVTPTIRPLSPQLKRVTSIWWNPKHEIESQAKQVDVDVSMLRTRSSECLKQFQIALQAKNFENAARLRKMGLVPLLRVWKSCNDDDTKDKHEMISALKASIGSDEKDEDEDEDGGNKKDWKAFIESKIDIVRKDIQSYVERRNWNEANKRQRVMLMPLERIRDMLIEILDSSNKLDGNQIKSYLIRIDWYMYHVVQGAIQDAISRNDFKEAFELSNCVFDVLKTVSDNMEWIVEGDEVDEEKNEEEKISTTKTATEPCVKTKENTKDKKTDDTVRGNKDNPKQFTENSSDAKYKHLELAVRRGKFMSREFYPHISGAANGMWIK